MGLQGQRLLLLVSPMNWLDEVIAQARAWDEDRPRSQQKALGWSALSGCRSYMGFRLRDEWESDQTDTWRAIVGTAMHEWLTGIRYEACLAAGHTASFEWEVFYGGVGGHIDEVVWDTAEVTDYKFPSLASARVWDDPEVLDERFIQPMGYAAGVLAREPDIDPESVLVRILVAPVNGTFDDWRTYERPFDYHQPDVALHRYQDVLSAVETGGDLPRDKPEWWCSRWCEFYSACRGGDPTSDELPDITDAELAAAIERYGLACEAESAAKAVKKDLGQLVDGVRGKARGFRSFPTRPGADKMVPDEQAMERTIEEVGRLVPFRTKPGRKPYQKIVRDK